VARSRNVRLRQGYGATAFALFYDASGDWWASGLEMTWIGVIVAVVTYGLGLAFGSFG
jgi:hypothetical protein